MTADSMVLPGESNAEFEARRRRLRAELAPRNELEAAMIDNIAREAWMSARADRAAAAQLAYRLRHERREEAFKEEAQVITLGQRLLKDVARPSGVTPNEQPGGLRHPGRLLVTLKSTVAGCEWLLGRLRQLRERALVPGVWLKNDGYELIRLLGKQRDELARDYQIAFVILASECVFEDSANQALAAAVLRDQALAAAEEKAELEANGPPPAREQRQAKHRKVTTHHSPLTTHQDKNLAPTPAYDEYDKLQSQLNRPARVLGDLGGSRPQQTTIGPAVLPLQRLNPPSVAEARRRLVLVIDEQVARLERLHAENVEVARADAADAAARLALELGPEDDTQRHSIGSRVRLLNETIQGYLKIRNATDAGAFDGYSPLNGDLTEGDEFDLGSDCHTDYKDSRRRVDPLLDVAADPSLTSSFGRAQGGPKCEQGSEAIRETVDQLVARIIREGTDYGDKAFLRNEVTAASPVSLPESAAARTDPSAQHRARPVPLSRTVEEPPTALGERALSPRLSARPWTWRRCPQPSSTRLPFSQARHQSRDG